MPYAATHILVAMIVVDTLRDHVFKLKKQLLPNKYVLIAGLAGLAPDTDVAISIFTGISFHRTFTHSIWIPLVLLAGFLVFRYMKKRKFYIIFLMCFTGVCIHLILDMLLLGTVDIFFPLDNTPYGLNLFLPFKKVEWNVFSAIDAILLFGWLIHEEMKHKISDYL